MSEQIPITPEILTWARERAGITIEEATRDFRKIASWEAGTSYPTYSQLEKLSDRLKVPIAVFFFPTPPQLPPITETFRTLPTSEIQLLPSRIRMLLRKAKAFQIGLSELTQGRNPSLRLITKDLTFPSTASVADMSVAVRNYLGVSMAQQQSWRDDEEANKQWRSALINAGIFVFKDAFRIEEFSGFCLDDENFPIIYVNNSSTKTRQIFTYFHELAHLMFHTSGIDPYSDNYIDRLNTDGRRIEILCNQFAAEFLLPNQAFSIATAQMPPTEATAEQIAAQFHVSREVVFRRFLDTGRITESQYRVAVEQWNQQRQAGKGEGGGDYYWTKLSYLSREYVSLALSQYHQNRISEDQLAEYLDVKPKNVDTLEEYFERGVP